MVRTKLFDPGQKFARHKGRFIRLDSALKKIGKLMLEASQEAFRRERFGLMKWEPRSVPNAYGLIADFSSSGRPKNRRFQEGPVLQDTGTLKRSIAFRVGREDVRIGTTVDYSTTMHDGGPIASERITEKVQERLGKWLKSSKGQPYKDRLGFLLNKSKKGDRLEGEVPARPFLGFTSALEQAIRKTTVDHFTVVRS